MDLCTWFGGEKMDNVDLFKEVDNDNIKMQIKEIKQENPALENEILITKNTLLKDIGEADKKMVSGFRLS